MSYLFVATFVTLWVGTIYGNQVLSTLYTIFIVGYYLISGLNDLLTTIRLFGGRNAAVVVPLRAESLGG